MGILVIDIHRTLIVSDSIAEIGVEGYALLSYISFRQDELRMLKKPRFFQKELMNFIGIYDERTFRKIRKKCMDSGWLSYIQRGTREAGEYEVSLPKYLCETSKDAAQRRLDSFDAPNDVPNDAPNHVPNDAPYSVPNHVPNDAPNHAPLSIPIPIPNPKPNPNPDNIILVDSGESTTKKPKPVKADYSKPFEDLWADLIQSNRAGDSKKTCAQRYETCRKDGLTHEQIVFGCQYWAKTNDVRQAEYRKGLSSWLHAVNVRDVLIGNVVVPKKSQKDMSFEERVYDNIKDFDFSKYETEDDEQPPMKELKA